MINDDQLYTAEWRWTHALRAAVETNSVIISVIILIISHCAVRHRLLLRDFRDKIGRDRYVCDHCSALAENKHRKNRIIPVKRVKHKTFISLWHYSQCMDYSKRKELFVKCMLIFIFIHRKVAKVALPSLLCCSQSNMYHLTHIILLFYTSCYIILIIMDLRCYDIQRIRF